MVSLDMAYCSFREVLAGLDTRLDMPPSIDSHHPDSDLAPVSARRAGGRVNRPISFGIGAEPGHHEHRRPNTKWAD